MSAGNDSTREGLGTLSHQCWAALGENNTTVQLRSGRPGAAGEPPHRSTTAVATLPVLVLLLRESPHVYSPAPDRGVPDGDT